MFCKGLRLITITSISKRIFGPLLVGHRALSEPKCRLTPPETRIVTMILRIKLLTKRGPKMRFERLVIVISLKPLQNIQA